MWRHTESINIVLLAEGLKLLCFITAVVVHNQQALRAYNSAFRMLNKVLELGHTMCVSSPTVITHSEPPARWYLVAFILGAVVVLGCKDKIWWDCLSSCVDPLYNCSPLAIALLQQFCIFTHLRTSYY